MATHATEHVCIEWANAGSTLTLWIYQYLRCLQSRARVSLINQQRTPNHLKILLGSSEQWRSQAKNLRRAKMFDFRRITPFCLEKRLSKHKMTIFSKSLGGHGSFPPPWLRLWFWKHNWSISSLHFSTCFCERSSIVQLYWNKWSQTHWQFHACSPKSLSQRFFKK